MHRFVAIAAVSLLLPTRAFPQDARPADPGESVSQLVHDVWRIEEGLPQNSVRAITQTHDGYLWLGTEEGLARYNGFGFAVFDKRTVSAFRGNHGIWALAEDAEKTLWIGTRGGGLVRYRHGVFEHVGSESGFHGRVVSAIVEAPGGELYIGTTDAGLFVGRDGRFTAIDIDAKMADDVIRSLARDRYGALWIGTRSGLFRLNHGRVTSWTEQDGLCNNVVMALEASEDGALWIGTEGGLCVYREGRFTDYGSTVLKLGEPVQSVLSDRSGKVWIGLDGGGIVRLAGGRVMYFDSHDGLSHDRVLSLFEDRERNVWIGTEGGGLNRLRRGKFTTYSEREGLSLDMVLAVYGDDQGTMWAGTEGGGLNRIRDGAITVLTTRDGLSSNTITSVAGGAEGELWIGTFRSGLNLMTDSGIRTFSTHDGLPGNGISALHRGATGSLWIGTDEGLAVYRNGRFEAISRRDGSSGGVVISVLESADGDVWAGTYEGGISLLRGDSLFSITMKDGLRSNTVAALHEDAEGTIWVGTYGGGLSRIRDGRVLSITTENGLFNDNVYQILEDDRGNLWMSCNKGIFYVAKADLDQFFLGEIPRVRSTSFDRSDGLRSYEMNGGFQPAGWRGVDGRLWFPTVKGLVSIDPSTLQDNNVAPTVVIEEVRVDGEVIDHRAGLALGPGRHKIEVEYAGLSFVDPEGLTYRYRLEGYERQWNNARHSRAATYTNLDPGDYRFEVQVGHSSDVWSGDTAALNLEISPSVYESTWFWLLVAAGVGALGLLLYIMRIRALKARQRELEEEVERRTSDLTSAKEALEHQTKSLAELYDFKTQFFNNISHELRTPLTLILGPLENAVTGAYGTMNGYLRGQLEIMLRNSRRLLRLINQLLDLAKLESGKMELSAAPGDIASFVEGVSLAFSAFAAEKDIDLSFDADENTSVVYFDPDKIEKVIFNLLSNALKFTPTAGRIEIAVRTADLNGREGEGRVDISVADTGPGIPKEAQAVIFDPYRQVDGVVSSVQEGTGIGLSLARELTELHGGSLSVQSVPGSGATFVVSLPVGSDHLEPGQISNSITDRDPQQQSQSESMVEMVGAVYDDIIAPAPHDAAASPESGSPRVLIVDDHRDIREYVRGCLQPDYEVFEAPNGRQGLELLESQDVDIILSDVMMPEMDGYEFTCHLKTEDRTSHIPLILLTAKASEINKVQGLEIGVDDYIAKPFNARELRARIRNLLRIREQEKELRELNSHLERRVEDQLARFLEDRRKHEQELVAARDAAEASSRMKSTILSNISHELRTPLSTILGYAQVLQTELSAEQRDFADLIAQGGRRLLSTLGMIIDLSQVESGSVELQATEFAVKSAIDEVVAGHAEYADRKGISLVVDYPPTEPIARLDRRKVQQIVGQILNNAVKFTDQGEVRVRLRQRDSDIVITVTDTGIGFDHTYMSQLFEPFSQESTGTSRTHEGSGLGLAVSRGLAEMMYGRIEARSKRGEGSEFVVTLPLRLPEEERKNADRGPVASDGRKTEDGTATPEGAGRSAA